MSDRGQPNRFAIVTGGGSGLGREFCLRLAQDGWRVAVTGIHRAGLEETLRLVADSGGTGHVEVCDVTDIGAWHALRDRLQSQWPRLDLLINNAGMLGSGFVGRLDLAETERVIRLNLFGAVFGCNAMVPWLIDSALPKRNSAVPTTPSPARFPPHIINVASIFAFVSPPGMSAYNMSKAGVVSLSETLSGELKPHGIGVTVVCPGPMPTRFIESASFESDAFRQLTEQVVAASTLQAKDVAAAAVKAMHRNQLYCVMGARERWYWRLKRFLPNTVLKLVARRVQRDLAYIGKGKQPRLKKNAPTTDN